MLIVAGFGSHSLRLRRDDRKEKCPASKTSLTAPAWECADPWPAARRELYEETNIRSVEKLGEIDEWLCYDIPRELVGKAWKGRYRGQCQKWYALRFTGDEREIDIAHPAGGHEPEFVEWRWGRMKKLPELVVPFKRPVYERVVKEFAKFAKSRKL